MQEFYTKVIIMQSEYFANKVFWQSLSDLKLNVWKKFENVYCISRCQPIYQCQRI